MSKKLLARVTGIPALLVFASLLSLGGLAFAVQIQHNVPSGLQQAVDLGPLTLHRR